MKVSEIFYSIQGESTFAGCPCVFVRLVGCNLRCSYCDTTYSYEGGEELTIERVMNQIKGYHCKLCQVTGGEPLLQREVYPLTERLVDEGYKVLVETNGSLPINLLDGRITRIVDIKCPQSGMSEKMCWSNLEVLKGSDEIKFVLSSRKDYDWAKEVCRRYSLNRKATVLFSVAFGRLAPKQVVEWILEDKLEVRFNLQLHKYIWEKTAPGV
jgi:7-carboxy-7-deazaguanine synthase